MSEKLPSGKDTASIRAEKLGPIIEVKPKPKQKPPKLEILQKKDSSSNASSILRRQKASPNALATISSNLSSTNINIETVSTGNILNPIIEEDIVLRAQRMAEEAKLKGPAESLQKASKKKNRKHLNNSNAKLPITLKKSS